MEVTLLSHGNCDAYYRVGEEKLRLWAIVGGTLALAFDDYSFQQRYNQVDKFNSKIDPNWLAWGGPRSSDLTNGEQTLIDFVTKNVPLRDLRNARIQEILQILGLTQYSREIVSKRFHDKDNRTYMYCYLEIKDYVPVVTVSSGCYWGRCDDEIQNCASSTWKRLASFLKLIFDKERDNFSTTMWENLSQFDYDCILNEFKIFAKELNLV